MDYLLWCMQRRCVRVTHKLMLLSTKKDVISSVMVPIAIASAYQMVMSLNQLINRSLLSMQAARGA